MPKAKALPADSAAVPDRIITYAEASAMTGGRRRETLWRWAQAGLFPAPRIVGPTAAGARGFLLSEVLAWIASRPVAAGSAQPDTSRGNLSKARAALANRRTSDSKSGDKS